MFIENGNNYFHILLRKGFLTGPFQNNEFIYKNYSSPTPEEINVELQALIQTKMGPDTYLLYPGGGMLFKFNESNGAIKRIDRSFLSVNSIVTKIDRVSIEEKRPITRPLVAKIFKNLHVNVGEDHKFSAQNPKPFNFN